MAKAQITQKDPDNINLRGRESSKVFDNMRKYLW